MWPDHPAPPSCESLTSPSQSPVVSLGSSPFEWIPYPQRPSVASADTMSTHPTAPTAPCAALLPQTSTASPGRRAQQGSSPLCIPTRPAEELTQSPAVRPGGIVFWATGCQDAGCVAHGDLSLTEAGSLSRNFSTGPCSLQRTQGPRPRLPRGVSGFAITAPGATRLGTCKYFASNFNACEALHRT